MSTLTETEDRYTGTWWPKRTTTAFERGSGCELFDEDGAAYLDLTAGYGTLPLGYSHPEVVAAISDQAQRLNACPNNLYSGPRARYLEKLASFLPDHLGRVFLCNSGTEANEAAIKFAVLATERPHLVAVKGSFHGRTLGALAATWSPAGRKPFEEIIGQTTFVTRDDEDALDEALDDSVAALILEVVQGEGGVFPLASSFLERAQTLCRERGVLLIVDEVQTGFGRTGSRFASQAAGLEADLMTLGKGIGGGFPLAAVAHTSAVSEKLSPGCHGTTFGGNALACAAGSATLDVLLRDQLDLHAAELGASLLENLDQRVAPLSLVKEIRGRGLMIGIQLRQRAGRFLAALCEEHHVLALPASPNVIRLLPPLTVNQSDLDRAVDALAEVLQ